MSVRLKASASINLVFIEDDHCLVCAVKALIIVTAISNLAMWETELTTQ